MKNSILENDNLRKSKNEDEFSYSNLTKFMCRYSLSFYPSYYVKENTRFNWKLKSCISFARYIYEYPISVISIRSLSFFNYEFSFKDRKRDNKYFIKELVKYSLKKEVSQTLRSGSKTIQYQLSTFIKNLIKHFESKINYQF